MASKKYAKADKSTCVACGSCQMVCPKGTIKVIQGCFAEVNEETCIGCGKCSKICPTGCITLAERRAVK